MKKLYRYIAMFVAIHIIALNINLVAYATGDAVINIYFEFDDGEEGYYISHPRMGRIRVDGNNIDFDSVYACINGEILYFDDVYTETSTYTYTSTYTDEKGEVFEEYEETTTISEYDIAFDSDGIYSGYISASDIYGRTARYDISEFCIDTVSPEITVSIDDETSLYTNRERKAYISVYDANMDECGEYEYVFKEGEDELYLEFVDKAGNVSSFQSEAYIQDYTLPSVVISGIEDGAHYNSTVIMDIAFEDANIDADNITVTLKGRSGDEYEIYGVLEEDGRYAMYVEDKNGFTDDYYILEFKAADMAGNVISDSYSFTINRKGSVFRIAEKIRELFNTFSEGVSDIKVEEDNLSPIDKSSVNIILTKNGRVVDIDYDEDVTVEETENSNGYRVTYSFNDELFKDNAVYTLSISDKDVAGNINDTRMFDETNDITFGVQRTEVLGAQATREEVESNDNGESIITNEEETDASEQGVKIVPATLILILMIVCLVLKIKGNRRK